MRHAVILVALACLSSAASADDCEILLRDPDLIVQHARDAIRSGDALVDGKLTPGNQCAYDRVPRWVESMIRHCKAGWAYESASYLTKNEIFGPCYPGRSFPK